MIYIGIFNMIVLVLLLLYTIRLEIVLRVRGKILKQNEGMFENFLKNKDKIRQNLELLDTINWWNLSKWTYKQFMQQNGG